MNSQIQQEKNKANSDFQIQANHCPQSSSQAYQQCVEQAHNTYNARLRAINDKQIKENTLYANNKLEIYQYWQGQFSSPATN